MNYLFIIQGEGKGHLSQAIAMEGILNREGHKVVNVYLGRSNQREAPSWAVDFFGDRLKFFRSPNFLRTADRKGIRLFSSLAFNILLLPLYALSILKLVRAIRKAETDKIFNFYDMLGGIAGFLSFSGKEFVAVSHHYFLESRYFGLPSSWFFQKNLLLFHNKLCALRAVEKRALSFRNEKNYALLRICPPLLRPEIFSLVPGKGGYILVYLLNEGFLEEIISLANSYASSFFRVFTGIQEALPLLPANLLVLKPDFNSFLSELANCDVFITTAGFDSQCEAAYLGKAVFTLPSRNHFEQYCNALDGMQAGISNGLEHFSPYATPDSRAILNFRQWCLSGENTC